MTSDLEQFLEVVRKVSSAVADDGGDVADHWHLVEAAGLPDLARDAAGQADSMHWIAHSVRAAGEFSPALAFVLAAHYAADLSMERETSVSACFAVASSRSRPVVPTSPTMESAVVLDLDAHVVSIVSLREADSSIRFESRTGLKRSRPASFDLAPGIATAGDPDAALLRWDLLIGAALLGIAERALRESQSYALERRQFGAAIGSFAGLRALVAGMQIRTESLRALFDAALDQHASADSVAALAGTVAMSNCIDAIQTHGGYGYITEYPLADLLRDAISLQARGGGRRLHVARTAARGLGAVGDLPS